MKKGFIHIFAAAALLATPLCAQEKPALQTLRETFAKYVSTLRGKYAGQQSALDATLLPKFDELEQARVEKGDLDGVLAVRKARENLRRALEAKELFDLPDNAETPGLRQAFDGHRDARAAIAEKEREENQKLAAKYAESLETLKRKLVTENKIEEALEAQRELDGLKPEPDPPPQTAKPVAPTPAKPEPEKPQPTPQPIVKNAPDPGGLLTTAELADNIQAYAGKTVRFYGRLENIEKENNVRLYLTFENGIRFRHDLINLRAQFGSGYDMYSLNRVYIFDIGTTFLLEATLSQAPKVGTPTSYRNITIRGCDDTRARGYLKVTCRAPCPDNIRQSGGCPWCK